MSSRKNSFKQAFTTARNAGQSMFYWNNKLYNTRKSGESEGDFRNSHQDYDAYMGFVGTYDDQKASKDDQGNPAYWGGWGKVPQQNYEPSTVYTGPTEVPDRNAYRRFDRFSRDNMKSLQFNDYASLVKAASNPENSTNPFVRALVGRFGDPSKWNQEYVERALGVGGKYRSFNFGGDYGKMETAMNTFIGDQNGRIDYHNGVYEQPVQEAQTLSDYWAELENKGKNYNSTFKPSAAFNPGFTNTMRAFDQKQYNFQKPIDFNLYQKYQLGGKMDEKKIQQQFMQYLAQKSGAKSQKELEQVIQQLGEEGLKKEYQNFIKLLQQQQVQSAKFGAKINYINYLRGNCPPGFDLTYYKQGGKLCKKCMKKRAQMENKGNTVNEFKSYYK